VKNRGTPVKESKSEEARTAIDQPESLSMRRSRKSPSEFEDWKKKK
jgi:hypothetical protein